MAEQNFAHHAKWVPAFHGFIVPVFGLNLGWSVYRWIHGGWTIDALVGVLTSVALFLLAFYARIFALTVQDRVIRLEERLRLERLLPADLTGKINQFSKDQLIAMRFADDAELPDLGRKVLKDNIVDRKSIKQLIQNWRPDQLRA